MILYNQLDSWQKTIAAHFTIIYDSNGGVYSSDHYTYLLPGLLGIPKSSAVQVLFECSNNVVIGRTCHDPVISTICSNYIKKTNRPLDNLIFYKTFKHDSFRAFVQSVTEDKSMVDVWVGASAVIGVISIITSAFNDFRRSRLTEGIAPELIEQKSDLLNKLLFNLNRLVNAWNKHGFISIDIHTELEVPDYVSIDARNIFMGIMEFVIYHELAHHFLGHLLAGNQTTEKLQQNEFEADRDAILITNRDLNIAPILCFFAASILQKSSDSFSSSTHPSLIHRVNNCMNVLAAINPDKDYLKQWFYGYLMPLARTIFGNIDDRDRYPDWFGYTKSDFVNGIKDVSSSNTVFDIKDFEVNDKFSFNDPNKQKPMKKKLEVDFI